jgi:peptidyl-prolyl cis-trans isomerase SurA
VSQAFGPRVKITEAEIDRAISAITAGSDVRVLISEIVIPLTPENAQAATEIAEQISKLTTTQAFSQAAAQVSAAPSAQNGGRLDWTPLTQLPPQLRPVLLALAPGEVSEPLPLNGAIALFQLRDIQETGVTQPSYAAIDYATYRLPGGRSAETLAQAAQIATQVATCDDLFAVGRTTPPEWLSRQSAAPGEIASDIALELAKLDAGELSYSLTRNNGQDLLLVMLCGRTPAVDIETDRQAVLSSLRNQRLASYAKSYLAQMRADAVIVSQ